MTKILVLLYFFCWFLTLIFYRKNLDLFHVFLVKLLVYIALVFCRLIFLNYFLKINTFNISIVFFILIIGSILMIYKIPSLVYKLKKIFKISRKNQFLEDLTKISKQQEIFRRKLFSLKIERYLYLSRFFYNKLSRNFIIFLYFLPHFLFCHFFLADVLFNNFLFISASIFSFTFLYNKLFFRIIIFAGFWANLFGLNDIIHPCYFDKILEKNSFSDFYNDVPLLAKDFAKGIPIYHIFATNMFLEKIPEEKWQSYREQCYLYKNFFVPAFNNYQLALKLRVFIKPCLWLYFIWTLQAFSYIVLNNFFIFLDEINSYWFIDYLSKDIFFTYLKINFLTGLCFSLFGWIFYFFDILYNLFFQKNFYVEVFEEYYIPALEEDFCKKYNTLAFFNFYKNYDKDKDMVTDKENLFPNLKFFWKFFKKILFLVFFFLVCYISFYLLFDFFCYFYKILRNVIN